MPTIENDESGILKAYEKGQLKSVATKGELAKFKAAARATAIKDRRVNIRLSSGDLSDIQVKALEEGIPYQTLINLYLRDCASNERKLDLEIEDAAVSSGMKTLYISGLELLLKGKTSFEELIRVLGPNLGRTV